MTIPAEVLRPSAFHTNDFCKETIFDKRIGDEKGPNIWRRLLCTQHHGYARDSLHIKPVVLLMRVDALKPEDVRSGARKAKEGPQVSTVTSLSYGISTVLECSRTFPQRMVSGEGTLLCWFCG